MDIGQRDDYSALAVVQEDPDDYLTLVALERVRYKPYPDVAQLVADTCAEMKDPTVLVDCTGVGRR